MLIKLDRKFWLGTATLVGSTIGVGVYGVPFVFQKSGFLVGVLFLIGLGGLMLLTNLLYGEVVLRTNQRHQLIGYSRLYLGGALSKINLFTFILGGYGALIGITIISSGFLSNIFSFLFHFSPTSWATFFVVVTSALILRGLRTVSRIDFFMMLIFGLIILFIGIWGSGSIHYENFNFATKDFWFLPFGVIIFSMAGLPGIPLAREVLSGRERSLRKALILGTLIPLILYLFFAFVVVGISGESTSPDAISGLAWYLGPGIVFVGSALGFLTSFTIFLNLGTAMKRALQEDFKFKSGWAWLLVVLPPYLLYLSGVRNFIDIISLVGGLAVSVEMMILIFVYANARKHGDRLPEYTIHIPLPLLYLMIAIFAFGAVYTLVFK
ncbi:MAG TPA: aromatic amino acid transport family protein [Candidatus Paceibacterota bacterium]